MQEHPRRSKAKTLVGNTINRLTLLKIVDGRDGVTGLFACSCGNETTIPIRKWTSGKIISCGCALKEFVGSINRTHGQSKTKEHQAWCWMRVRCNNKNRQTWHNYGGRGIKVCRRWNKFENFLADMGLAPDGKQTVERIDNNGNYEPKNCKWASREEQAKNTRRNVYLTYMGKTLIVVDWAKRLGISPYTIYNRKKRGLTDSECLRKH